MRNALATATLLVLFCSGCKPSGPASTNTKSSGVATVFERVKFLHEYVSFGRSYEMLDFDILCKNNGGTVPSPSGWDVRIVATVPSVELTA